MIDFISKDRYDFDDLVRLVALLRAPGGCPWDGAQTHLSIRRNFLEEAYEACEGFDLDDPKRMCEELGDVLLQVLFHTDIERAAGRFTLDDVCDGVCKKLVFRHPFLFGEATGESWEELKQHEKGQTTVTETLDGVARSLPALWRADKLQSKAARDGFDWPDISGALDKLDEEVSELHRAAAGDGDVTEELGDVLFAAVKVGRFVGVDPEVAIHGTCEKFIRRYRAVEEGAAAMGRSVDQLPLETLEALWAEAKRS